jgi:hypothetical protein
MFVTMSQEKSLTPLKRFLLLLMGIVFLLMAGGSVLHALGNAVGIAKFQLSWQPSTCSIVSGDVRQTKNQHYEPTIDFTYEAGGVLYKSSSLYPSSISFGTYTKYTNYQEAEDWLLAFPAGHADCYVYVGSPPQAALKGPEMLTALLQLLFILGFGTMGVLLGLVILAIAVLPANAEQWEGKDRPGSWVHKEKAILALALSAGFMACIALTIGIVQIPGALSEFQGSSWQVTTCTILDKGIREDRSIAANHTTISYIPNILYTYRAGEQVYKSNRIYEQRWLPSNGYLKTRELLRSFQKGETVPCFYDADKPRRSVLMRNESFPWATIIPILIPLASGIGIGCFSLNMLRKWLQSRQLGSL